MAEKRKRIPQPLNLRACLDTRIVERHDESMATRDKESPPSCEPHPASVQDKRVRDAIAKVAESLCDRVNVSELARSVGMSRASFARKFTEETGVPPERYLTQLRLREAAKRLVSTDHGLARIAAELGYSSEFALSRAFKRVYGLPPGQYRARFRPTATTMCLRMAA